MDMIIVPIAVPAAMQPYLNDTDHDRSFERNAMFLYPFIKDMTISHGRAAEILGVNKLDLIDYYCRIGLPYLNQSISDVETDLETLRSLRRKKNGNCI